MSAGRTPGEALDPDGVTPAVAPAGGTVRVPAAKGQPKAKPAKKAAPAKKAKEPRAKAPADAGAASAPEGAASEPASAPKAPASAKPGGKAKPTGKKAAKDTSQGKPPTGAPPEPAGSGPIPEADPPVVPAVPEAVAVTAEELHVAVEEVPVVRESRWSARDRAREQELLAILSELPAEDPARVAARDELVTMHMPLAAFLARRFRDRGEHLDDLTQVATVGLIKAVDRFEPGRGVEFSTFATPTMVGEIKRHFRDKGWAIRVPRRLQELRLAITKATAELSQTSGSSPTVAELAEHLGITQDEVLEGLESAAAYATISLDSTSGGGSDEGASIAETLGNDDPSLVEVDNRATLHPLLAELGQREQKIIYMRFFENKTQAQIAEEVGVSQMHVSRLLAKSLAQLRTGLTEQHDHS